MECCNGPLTRARRKSGRGFEFLTLRIFMRLWRNFGKRARLRILWVTAIFLVNKGVHGKVSASSTVVWLKTRSSTRASISTDVTSGLANPSCFFRRNFLHVNGFIPRTSLGNRLPLVFKEQLIQFGSRWVNFKVLEIWILVKSFFVFFLNTLIHLCLLAKYLGRVSF